MRGAWPSNTIWSCSGAPPLIRRSCAKAITWRLSTSWEADSGLLRGPLANMDTFTIADKTFSSRLIVGTGKYTSPAVMVKAHEASGAEMVTVAVRRVNISDRTHESLLDYIDTSKYFLLPNTAGCYSAGEAIRTARLGREAGLSNW